MVPALEALDVALAQVLSISAGNAARAGVTIRSVQLVQHLAGRFLLDVRVESATVTCPIGLCAE